MYGDAPAFISFKKIVRELNRRGQRALHLQGRAGECGGGAGGTLSSPTLMLLKRS